MPVKYILVAILLTVMSAAAQSPAPTPAPTPTPASVPVVGTPVPAADQLKLLKSQHTVDSSNVEMSQIVARWNAMEDERRALRTQADVVTKRITDSQKTLDADIDATLTSAKLDKSKWTISDDKTMFVKRPEPTPAPPLHPPVVERQ